MQSIIDSVTHKVADDWTFFRVSANPEFTDGTRMWMLQFYASG